MATRPQPGFAWFIACDVGFAVGLVTHYLPRFGHLVWMAQPVFDEEPTTDDVIAITEWRWPVLFPLGAAVHRHIATKIGTVPIPESLNRAPTMRSRKGKGKWSALRLVDTGPSVPLGPTDDRSLPIYQVVNDTRLKEMLVSGWVPEREW